MNNRQIRNSFLLALAAFIWGIAFVAQRRGGDIIGPYTFNCIRSLIGAAVLLPVIIFMERKNLAHASHDSGGSSKQGGDSSPGQSSARTPGQTRREWTGGIACGFMLFLATNAQQLGMYYGTTAGKAGFLTACYILLVPILGIFLKKKCTWNIWTGVALALAGLYFLCMDKTLTIQFSDLLVLTCALVFAFHILTVEHFSPLVNGVRLSAIQFLICGLLTAVPMIVLEVGHTPESLSRWCATLAAPDAWIPLLYAGVLSCGVGYTLQIIGQNGINPTLASLVMSLESVFSVLAGWILLHEYLTLREFSGCVLIFAAIILAQIPVSAP